MERQEKIEMPAPTAWPLVLAFGLTLVFAGFVTAAGVSILGTVLAVAGGVGWFRNVLPAESLEWVVPTHEAASIATSRRSVERLSEVSTASRVWLPVRIHPISAGIKGGLAGSAVMASIASAYGTFSGNGIWYPMNLLVAGLFAPMAGETAKQIGAFHFDRFVVAVLVHLTISLLVGLLYGAMLPMLPRHPILLGGFVAPFLWSGLVYGALSFVDPVMNERIDWTWFVASQFAFGIVAGIVVAAQEQISTRQLLPRSARLDLEASGLDSSEDQR